MSAEMEKESAATCVKFIQTVLTNTIPGSPNAHIHTQLTEGERESLDVATQCISAAFHLDDHIISEAPDLLAAITFITRATAAARNATSASAPAPTPASAPTPNPTPAPAPTPNTHPDPLPSPPPSADAALPPTDEAKEMSVKLKDEGNELMKAEKFKDALLKYNEAISVEPRNPVFYCNRAAAYYYLAMYPHSLADCGHALELNPQYGRAYGRMGLAYTQLGRHLDARQAYAMAVRMEPDNDNYKNNLKFAEDAIAQEQRQRQQQQPGGLPPFGMAGFGNLLQNPALMTAAQQMLANPEMRNLMSNLVQGVMSGNPTLDPTDDGPPPAPINLENLNERFAQINPSDINQVFEQIFGQNRQQPPNPNQQPPSAPPS